MEKNPIPSPAKSEAPVEPKPEPKTPVDILSAMGSFQHLDRDKAENLWEARLKAWKPEEVETASGEVEKKIEEMLGSKRWEDRYGALAAAGQWFVHVDLGKKSHQEFKAHVLERITGLIIDPEFRVRIAVGLVLKTLVKREGVKIYEMFRAPLLKSIEACFVRAADKAEEDLGQPKNQEVYYDNPSTKEAPGAPIKDPRKLHDSEGWQHLETSMRILQKVAEGAELSFVPFLDEELFSVIERATKHLNRFVREIGLSLCTTIFQVSDLKAIKNIGPRFAPLIARGLADNWSQVRYMASTAVRTFFAVGNSDEEVRKVYYPQFLPMMCLNRYYLAEGVRLYSQQSWKDVVGEKGKDYVIQYIDEFVKYYISQSRADNHAVREAACHCLSELCSKIVPVNRDRVKSHVTEMLKCLIDCFKDQSWPVRDAACVACGHFVLVTYMRASIE